MPGHLLRIHAPGIGYPAPIFPASILPFRLGREPEEFVVFTHIESGDILSGIVPGYVFHRMVGILSKK